MGYSGEVHNCICSKSYMFEIFYVIFLYLNINIKNIVSEKLYSSNALRPRMTSLPCTQLTVFLDNNEYIQQLDLNALENNEFFLSELLFLKPYPIIQMLFYYCIHSLLCIYFVL